LEGGCGLLDVIWEKDTEVGELFCMAARALMVETACKQAVI